MLSRRRFLGYAAAASAVPVLPTPTPVQTPEGFERVSHGLVLSGGGARGSYQAGIISALAQATEARDGMPLTPYGFVCGTSIGALNGWMVATGQYTHLQTLWTSIASQNIMRIKPEFAAIANPNSGVGTRIYQAVHLANGLRSNVRGIIQSEPVVEWIHANIDLSAPVLVPFIWTSTNLTAQRTEYFYRTPAAIPSDRKQALLELFQRTLGPSAVFREFPDELIVDALFASAALPVVFDPVLLPSVDGKEMHQYVDGGVAANTPVLLARTVAREVDVILLDPPFEPQSYENAEEITWAVYGTMQRRLLENDIRAAFVETLTKSQLAQMASTTGMSQAQDAALVAHFSNFAETNLGYIRPAQVLPVGVGEFNDGAKIQQAVALGEQDARAGFTPYTIDDFLGQAK